MAQHTISPVTWDRYAFSIHGKKQLLIGGEFHYWRIPDRERWRDILIMYRTAGLNMVRIYFHWGFHNPAEGVFIFDGNRDVDYLLKICEEIGLYVLIASGPYICAETTGGGYPLWLVPKREVRIKHVKSNLRIEYDSEYMKYCRFWFEAFIPHVKSHQITENPKGCIIGYQIENEYDEKIGPILGSRKYMLELMEIVRNCGITVPNYHNDDKERGSWNGIPNLLYGFDKYVIVMNFPARKKPIPPWSTQKFCKSTNHLEKVVSKMKPLASQTPMFIPELQGGWFNHWGTWYGFDELYDWYGSSYQKLVVESMIAQRVTAMDLYMFYGGTNYGNVPNPEVYTSYDYAACIREFGFQSDRLRYLRLFLLFARSFETSLTTTDLVLKPTITLSNRHFFNRQRRSTDGTDFYFLRNFAHDNETTFTIKLDSGMIIPHTGTHKLVSRESYVAIGNYKLPGFTIHFCSLPIILKGEYADGILLIVERNGGELILNGTSFKKEGDIKSFEDKGYTRFTFNKEGAGKIFSAEGKILYLLCLSKQDLLTLNAEFTGKKMSVAWGAYGIYFADDKQLMLETIGTQQVQYLSNTIMKPDFTPVVDSIIPGLMRCLVGTRSLPPSVKLGEWSQKIISFENFISDPVWKEIPFSNRNSLDHNYLGCYVLYRGIFTPNPGKRIKLKLNIRHKVGLWLNGKCLGGHHSYSWGVGRAGAMNGPDPSFDGYKIYDLTSGIKFGESNTLLILTENLGLNKAFWLFGDIRNPRGLLQAKIFPKVEKIQWAIAGVNSSTYKDTFDLTGFPGEDGWRTGQGTGWTLLTGKLSPDPNQFFTIYRTEFQWQPKVNRRSPLRLHLEGPQNVNIYLNGHCVGRYWGEKGPQHDFYLMDGLLQSGSNSIVLGVWTTQAGALGVDLKLYRINPASGNIDDAHGIDFICDRQ